MSVPAPFDVMDALSPPTAGFAHATAVLGLTMVGKKVYVIKGKHGFMVCRFISLIMRVFVHR